ncbi:Stress responsive A B barrel domain protein [Fusarium sp. NRRL 25303]|nr:Stress responsive A B barrel domain protein [Fusarium sp. NRRL 25303]
MSITHTVLFQFKDSVDQKDVTKTCDDFLQLKDLCIHPTSNKPYIISLQGGKDNSPEGMQNGITHGFVATFESAEDRDYYVKTDPAHQTFIAQVGGLVERAIVVDFTNGVY